MPFTASSNLVPHTFLTVLSNRHYVVPQLKQELIIVSNKFQKSSSGLKVIYLNANFPFWNGFPLLPHLSHNDGKKIDLSFIYRKDGKLTNQKPARSGYGHFENPHETEENQHHKCTQRGYWQYGYAKYLTFGVSDDFEFDANHTRTWINLLLNRRQTQKLFIEPHLKARMGLTHEKLRYQGCHSVRHDDHIHYQIN